MIFVGVKIDLYISGFRNAFSLIKLCSN